MGWFRDDDGVDPSEERVMTEFVLGQADVDDAAAAKLVQPDVLSTLRRISLRDR